MGSDSVRDTLDIAPEGDEIIKIVESFGWALYDVTEAMNNHEPYDRDARDYEPAQYLGAYMPYLFCPKLEKGQTVYEAFRCNNSMPLFFLDNPADKTRWMRIKTSIKSQQVVLPSHLMCRKGHGEVVVFRQETEQVAGNELLIMPVHRAIENFRDCFRIVPNLEAANLVKLAVHQGKVN